MSNYRKMKRVCEWKFPPSKPFDVNGKPIDPWVVTKWDNGTYSCTCPIWVQKRQVDEKTGERRCKHLRGVMVAEAMEKGAREVSINVTIPLPNPVLKAGKRRIILEED